MTDIGYIAAFLAGLLSFLSPCVLPLVPPYLCYIAGTSIEELSEVDARSARWRIVGVSLLFVAGFTTVFVLLGATASVLGLILRQYIWLLSWAAGAAIIIMGLHFIGLFRLSVLYREKRAHVSKPAGPLGAYVMGIAFAFGWTPCIGPVLAAILAVAGSSDTVGRGMSLLAIYALGLGMPFIMAALTLGRVATLIQRFQSSFRKVEIVMGCLLVITGLAFLTGGMERMSFWLLETFPVLSQLG
jgi:cytochrome c-type biogenesis protein